MRSTCLAACLLFGCAASTPAARPWPAEVCEALIEAPPINDKAEMIEWGARLDACLRSELVGQKVAPWPLTDDDLGTLALSSPLFCPEGADASRRNGPCWRTDCPGLPIRVQPTQDTLGLNGVRVYTIERGSPPGDGEPTSGCLDNATVGVLGDASRQPGGLVVRVDWTEQRGSWARCWMVIIQPNDGRPAVTWSSPVWRCG